MVCFDSHTILLLQHENLNDRNFECRVSKNSKFGKRLDRKTWFIILAWLFSMKFLFNIGARVPFFVVVTFVDFVTADTLQRCFWGIVTNMLQPNTKSIFWSKENLNKSYDSRYIINRTFCSSNWNLFFFNCHRVGNSQENSLTTEVIVVIIKNAKDFGHDSFRNLDRALHHNNRTLGSKGRLARKILIKTFLQCVDNALAEMRAAYQRRNREAQFFDCVDVSNYLLKTKIILN